MTTTFKHLIPVGPDIWNVRAPFKLFHGLMDIGTHMTIIKLASGRFLIIDTLDVNTPATLKQELDTLTENGAKIEAVIATHPFHTVYFRPFHQLYPNAKYYGTPRHLRIIKDVPWAGDLNSCETRKLWEPEVEMRIPAGSEFVNPLPESRNHFSNVFVFHKKSRTVHNDDTFMVSHNPGFVLSLFGVKDGQMMLHPSVKNVGLLPRPDAPQQFKSWVEDMLRDWDFDNLLTAHNGNHLGGAKQEILKTLERAEGIFAKHTKKWRNAPIEVHKAENEPHEHNACG